MGSAYLMADPYYDGEFQMNNQTKKKETWGEGEDFRTRTTYITDITNIGQGSRPYRICVMY